MSKGYIYILINASLQKNYLKIGMTTRTPDLRAKELSEGTGMPSEYIVAWAKEVSNCEEAEAAIFDKLRPYRITHIRPDRNREFFNLPLKKAIKAIDELIEKFEADSISDMYLVIMFDIDDLDELIEKIGHNCVQDLIRKIFGHIYKYFLSYGAFASRDENNEFSVLIPNSNTEKGENILKNFTGYFKEKIIPDIKANIRIEKSDEMFKVHILAGTAQGKPMIEIDSVKEFARFNCKPFVSIIL